MKVRFNSASIGSTVEAAKRLRADHDLYIVPSANGFSILHQSPPMWLRHIVVRPDGSSYKGVAFEIQDEG